MSADHPRGRPRPRLTWKSRVLLVTFGVLLASLVLEGGLRAWAAFVPQATNEGWAADQNIDQEYWAVYDPDLGYRQNPKFADMNADGLRDRPIGPKANRFRVLFLGDSLAVYGDSVDDTFVGHVRANLRANPSLGQVDVVNAGVKGYTNYQQVLLLKKVAIGFEPDLVGFQCCLNDLFQFLHSFQLENGRLVPGSYRFSTEAVAQGRESFAVRVARKSRLLVWLNDNLSIARNAVTWGLRQGFSFDYRVDVQNAWRDEPWLAIEKQLAEAVALGQSRGFPVFVVAFPLAAQYDPGYLAKDRDYVLKPQRKLREVCERLKIPFYDIYPDLAAGHFLEDGLHLTGEGRQVAGRAIAGFLIRSGLLPE